MRVEMTKYCVVGLCSLIGLVSCGSDAMQEPGGIGTTREEVQDSFTTIEGLGGDAATKILTTSSNKAFAALIAPGSPGWICGLTFISKTYAITAAHCVDASTATGKPTPFAFEPSGGFTVKQIDTTGIQTFTQTLMLLSSAAVSGTTFPNWTIGHTLTPTDGYVVTPMTCKVTKRCHSGFGTSNCASVPTDADIALVHCAGRTATNYVTVNTGDPSSGSVVTNWFHEVLTLMKNSNDTAHNTPPNNWANYGFFDKNDATNWHYLKASTNQLLPLQFAHWKGGASYTITGPRAFFNNEIFTDQPGCHGTSGSGVFLSGTSTLLGPVANGMMGKRLCYDMDTAPHSGQNISYVFPAHARTLESLAIVQNDR